MKTHTELTPRSLARMPLPAVSADAGKDDRGSALIIGGSRTVPGAVHLAGVATLRAGAGKLQVATARSAAPSLAIAVPEALVVPLAETRGGEISASHARSALSKYVNAASAILLGSGISSARAARSLLSAVMPRMGDEATLVLDAAAAECLHDDPEILHRLECRAVLTPHAGEMAALMGIDREEVERAPAQCARGVADTCRAVVVLKGPTTWIANPDGVLIRHAGGSAGLGTSGSGDVLAGVIAGLLARGAPPVTAAAWGVYAHGAAGSALSRKVAHVGFLARELLGEIPALLQSPSRPVPRKSTPRTR